MSTTLAIILIVLIALGAVAAWAILHKRRSAALRGRFGPEYERAIDDYHGKTREAEKALEHRAQRAAYYHIRSLNPDERDRFANEWRQTQSHFVDDPALSVREADHLVSEVMRVRGYPVAEFERRAEDLSVEHPSVVRNYREAHAIALLQEQNRATTEDLRKGIVHYRELFDELLEMPVTSQRSR